MSKSIIIDWTQVDEDNVDTLIQTEMEYGRNKFGKYNSWHEAYAVIWEELEEWWETVRADDPDPAELLQVCATARRALLEMCEKKRQLNESPK